MSSADRGEPTREDMLMALARSNVALSDLSTALAGILKALRAKGIAPTGRRVDAVSDALKVASIAAIENQRVIARSGGWNGSGS